VPRWDLAFDEELDPPSLAFFFRANDGFYLPSAKPPAAANDRIWLAYEQGSILRIKGVQLDTVQATSVRMISADFGDAAALENLLLDFEDDVAADAESKVIENGDALLSATLLAGRNSHRHPVADQDLQGLQTLLKWIWEDETLPPEPSVWVEDNDTEAIAAYQYYDALINACQNLQFLLTEDARMALAHYQIKPGDIVVVAYGGIWPIILRPCDDGTYQ